LELGKMHSPQLPHSTQVCTGRNQGRTCDSQFQGEHRYSAYMKVMNDHIPIST
jgi:hypothetical protein